MKNLFNAILRLIVKLALHVYFSKIKVHGADNIPKGKAVLIVSNHQNALIDPILIATHTNLKPHFLTRASVFKKSFVAKLLDFIRMIPIYRVRDGINNMEKNNETFEKSVNILLEKGSIVIFAEGNHSNQRNLRPLKKGFARIAYQALEREPDLDLVILPVGINYSNHRFSGSKVSLTFGAPISPREYIPLFEPLMVETFKSLEPLVSTIPEADYQKNLDDLIKSRIDLTKPDDVKEFLSNKPQKTPEKPYSKPYFSNKVMKVLHFPIYWIWLWIRPKIQDLVFYATFKFVIGLVMIPLWYGFLVFGLPKLGLVEWSFSWAFLGVVYLLANRNGQE
ncbi:lysophospholipid acyltransferase family protein [Aquiflexum sp. LQ15W]|uniref:lysophospholipid acyltransferase family protein n=1 Tax=Cognataquiflexum nitidum TaxID=2922272 RepID=UPI001F146207|nr:lysophospholipid acyltransferase family protein [Cognataquiflexum nitidum]MCH6200455.1 lysophospholipid acyltransferase family protein [Cognataquiflexum nitidum]